MTRVPRLAPALALAFAMAAPIGAQEPGEARRKPLDEAGIARLVAETGGSAKVSIHEGTGSARFVRLRDGQARASAGARTGAPRAPRGDRSREFLNRHRGIFGIRSAASELEEVRVDTDRERGTHITYRQRYQGLPVFAGELKSHFDAADELTAVSGTFIPEISVNPNPARSAEEASATAVRRVEVDLGRTGLSARGSELLIFREGLAKGVPGPNHLAWKVEVGDGAGVREFVFIDAHTGKFIDQITGIHDGLYRRAYNATGLTAPGPNYPASPFWVEGQTPFPTGNVEADNMILASGETYGLFSSAFGRDSFDGAGATMDSIFNRGNGCPNASWNGTFISFCPGLTTDDITGHEWAHAYTEYTHNLIYQWQPGALNESYSDIFGETVDRINSRGGDTPNNPRTAGSCSVFTPLPPTVTINAPAAIAGVKSAGTAAFGLQVFALTNDVVEVDDGVGTLNDGCTSPFVNAAAVAGKIAFMDRGVCGFAVKAKNAQLNGAVGVIIGNNQGGTAVVNMAGVDPTVVIPSLSVTQNDGTAIKGQLVSTTVNTTLSRGATGTDNSVNWLLGEDSTAPGLTGALRDMWSPTCYGNPGKVSDAQYTCSTADGGGVHSNSGVPNHAYALLVDGGSYNGQTISSIGLTKAAHIYYRAMSVYQGPASDFADHADALDQSCSDLVGVNLADLSTGFPSGQVIGASDCAEVAKAALAVELRTPPSQCGFQPLLAPDPPNRCEAGTAQANVYFNDFESLPAGWTVSHEALAPADFTPRDWEWTSALPDGRPGSAFFGIDFPGGTCAPGGDESGVLHLDSPVIALPAGAIAPRLTFDHWVATEAGWDGANFKISVNGGPFLPVSYLDYTFNSYNALLFTGPQGNTNPLAGEEAFTGADQGSVSGSWGRSHLNLAPYASPGDSVQLRYDIGTDGCSGTFGWYVDDVTVYACPADTRPSISISDVSVVEGDEHSTTDAVFTVSLSQASAQSVGVRFETRSGTAKQGADYRKTQGTLTIRPLSLTGSVRVRVKGDKKFEADETFTVVLSRPVNGTIADGTGVGTIVNDDVKKPKKGKHDDDDDDDRDDHRDEGDHDDHDDHDDRRGHRR